MELFKFKENRPSFAEMYEICSEGFQMAFKTGYARTYANDLPESLVFITGSKKTKEYVTLLVNKIEVLQNSGKWAKLTWRIGVLFLVCILARVIWSDATKTKHYISREKEKAENKKVTMCFIGTMLPMSFAACVLICKGWQQVSYASQIQKAVLHSL